MGEFGFSGKLLGIDYALLPNREWNQKHKKQPWGNLECVAFGGATVRFASLETSFHAANHTIPPPPSYEGLPLCPKDKNRSPFHGEKPLKIVICFYEAMSKRQTKGTVLLVCGLRLRLESATPHHQRRPRQRGRWHRQKDKKPLAFAEKPNPVGT